MSAGQTRSPHGYNVADVLGIMESAVYLIVSVFLVIMALMTFILVGMNLASILRQPITMGIIMVAMPDLMTTLIIVELIQTVVVYIKNHRLDIKLVLAAGLTAMIRRILVFGMGPVSPEDVAATGILLLVLVVAIYLIGGHKITIKHLSR